LAREHGLTVLKLGDVVELCWHWQVREGSVSRFSDKTLACRDCGKEFSFTAGEQEFYETKGFSEPTRCPDCRAARKASRDGSSGGSSYGSGRSSYGSGSSYGRSGESRSPEGRGGTRQMYKVICADCGNETEVPFEPRSGRPVYCRDCFDKRGGRH
jgi:CxxC-x17-CxxC domain-containing protein